MSTDEQSALKERLMTFPVEPFNNETNIYPYYVIFANGGVQVKVPIALDANTYCCIQENSSLFLEKLKDQLSTMFPKKLPENTSMSPRLDSKKSYILVSDTSKQDLAIVNPSEHSITSSSFDEMINFQSEFRRIRCFYGLTYSDVAQSLSDCYKVNQSAYMIYRLERCSLTAWKHSQVLALIRRWMADMKTPKRRARLFPPWKLKQSLLMRYEKLGSKSITFTKDQQAEMEKFYTKKNKPCNGDLKELKQKLGLQVWKIRYWLRERELLDEHG